MVLTDRQRTDLHAAIYAYLLSREGKHFEEAAEALAEAEPSCAVAVEVSDEGSVSTRFSKMSVGSTSRIADLPILERKWTAVPRLQRKIMELEKTLAANAKLYAHKPVSSSVTGIVTNGSSSLEGRRMLPRLPSTHTLEGHSSVVTCVALHPKFTTAASGSEDGTIKLWDHESGEYQRTLKGHTNNVHSVDFTPSGSHLVSCSSDLSIKIWDLSTYTCIRTLRGHDHTISAVKFIPLASNDSSDIADGVKVTDASSTGINSNTTGCQFLVSASRDNSVKFWDVETGFCDATLNYHNDWVRCLAVRTMDGEIVASAGNDQTIHVCKSTGSREKIATLNGHEHVVECLAFVTVPAPSEKKEIKLENKDTVKDYLVSGGRDRTVRLWNIVTQECLSVFKYHENWVRSIALHPSGKYILSTGDDRSIRILDIKSNRCIRTLDDAHSHFITSLAIHHTLPIMVTGSVDQTVRCWQLD
jgi:platelet-activating factor acetylhydrolase IB subunit alpha